MTALRASSLSRNSPDRFSPIETFLGGELLAWVDVVAVAETATEVGVPDVVVVELVVELVLIRIPLGEIAHEALGVARVELVVVELVVFIDHVGGIEKDRTHHFLRPSLVFEDKKEKPISGEMTMLGNNPNISANTGFSYLFELSSNKQTRETTAKLCLFENPSVFQLFLSQFESLKNAVI